MQHVPIFSLSRVHLQDRLHDKYIHVKTYNHNEVKPKIFFDLQLIYEAILSFIHIDLKLYNLFINL